MSVPVKYGDQEAKLPALVIGGDGPNLIGRDWLKVIRINWSQIFKVEAKQQVANHGLQLVLEEHKEVFQEELETLNGVEAKIYVDEKASPLYLKACPVPYALKKRVEDECRHKLGTPARFAEEKKGVEMESRAAGSV